VADDGIGRMVKIVITPGGSAPLTNVKFVQATTHVAGQPYVYYVYVTSSLLGSGGLSLGWILIITLVVLIVVYLVAGIAYNRFKLEKSGVELVPNVEFWKESPVYFKEGVLIAKEKIVSLYESVTNRSSL